MTENILEQVEEAPAEQVVDPAPVENEVKVSAAELALLKKRLSDKDEFIETLKREKTGALGDLEKLSREVETLRQLREELQKRNDNQPKDAQPDPVAAERKVKEMLEATLAERETKARMSENVAKVNEALMAHYSGDAAKAKEAVVARAKDLGMPPQELTALAAKNPKLALELLKVNAADKPADVQQLKPSSSVNVDALANAGATPQQTKAAFDKMRRENPAQYWSGPVQLQLAKLVREGKYAS